MEEIVKVVMESMTEVLVLTVLSLAGIVVAKAKAFIKAKTSKEQYIMLAQISKDVYEYVEREFGDKLREQGEQKLERAMEVFDGQMKKHDLPFTAVDFKLQVEKIIREEKKRQIPPAPPAPPQKDKIGF